MALNIKDPETEKLAAEVAELTEDSKTGAVRAALREKRERLHLRSGGKGRTQLSMREWLETEIWPHIPEGELDKPPMTKDEWDELNDEGPGQHGPR